jgi:pyruvate/2-oxoglutarate dehydrogenase complex dihydrolipoamide dehydrogenase (E3) component
MSGDSFDFVIIGAGAAGEAAAYLARELGASTAIVDRDLFGGSCPFWACMPSKTLLHAAGIHALGGDYPWPRASDRRDWMIVREQRAYPDDAGHVRGLLDAGAVPIRGTARLAGPGNVVVTSDAGDATGARERTLTARHVVIAVGSNSTIPPVEGLDAARPWTNREGTSLRQLPRSLAILGGGPTGVELAQVYARYGVPVVIAHPHDRLNDRDHPRNSAAVEAALRHDGVDVRTNVRATRILAGAGADGAHRIELGPDDSIEGHEILLAVGRTVPLDGLGLDTIGVALEHGRVRPDDRLRIAENVYVAGDIAGPEMHTHVAHYQGELAVRIALGEDVRADYRAIPRATYTDPETAGVGLRLDQALAAGLDAFEVTADVATTAKGYVSESSGHVSIVVDRGSQTLVGAFIAGPAASETLHEAVLAVRTRTPLAVLADTIHAFPTLARVLGSTFIDAHRHQGRAS